MSGLIPALPLILIRPFLAGVAQVGARRKPPAHSGVRVLKSCSSRALRRTTILTTLMFACSFGAAFGAIQQMPQMVPGLPEVKQQVKERQESKEVQGLIAKRLSSEEVQKQLKGKSEAEQKKILAIERKKILGREGKRD